MLNNKKQMHHTIMFHIMLVENFVVISESIKQRTINATMLEQNIKAK